MKKQALLRQKLKEKHIGIIHSSDPCDYCIHKDDKREHCNPCYEHAGFDGRKVKEIEQE